MKRVSVVDVTLIGAPSSTKNQGKQRDPEMSQTKNGTRWYFGMKAHIGVDAESALIHSVEFTATKVIGNVMLKECLHGDERIDFADRRYQHSNGAIAHLASEDD